MIKVQHPFRNFDCETMGLQATSPPTSPLHRMPPAYHHAGLKRKHGNLEKDDLMPSNAIESSHLPDDAKKIRVEVVCGHQSATQTAPTSPSNTDSLSDQENRLLSTNNNAKELEKDQISTQGEENKENQKQSPVSPGTYAARKSSPTPTFFEEENIEKEQNRTFFASKSLSPKTNLSSKVTEDTKLSDNDDSGIKMNNTDEDSEDDESNDEVGGGTSEDDEYEEDGSEEGSEGFSSSLSPSPPHTTSAEAHSVGDLSVAIRNCDNRHHHSTQTHPEFQSLHSQSAVSSLNPKVIVEHQPLPSIYDLQQMSAACDNLESECNFDSGLSEDDSCCGDSEDDAEGDSDSSGEDLNLMMQSNGNSQSQLTSSNTNNPQVSPLFDPVLRGTSNKQVMPQMITPTPPTPKVIYNDRFWNQGLPFNHTPPPPSSNSLSSQQQVPQSQQSMNVLNSTFTFLEPSNQRIECAENGKSYMQLGTMSHHHSGHPSGVSNNQANPANHHLPVTPVIQPKPNMVYRRPIPPFRNPVNGHGQLGPQQNNLSSAAMIHLQAARPVCDHTNCLQRKSSFCYRNQRSRMLNMSLHKLHMARQNHEGCLRRSVLICNMLRFIEDETEKEAIQEAHQQFPGIPNTSPPHMMETDQYWPPPQPSPNAPGMQHQPMVGHNGANVPPHQSQLLPSMNGNHHVSPQELSMPATNSLPSADGTSNYVIGSPSMNSAVASYHNVHNVQNSSLPSNMATGNSNATQQQLLNHSAVSSGTMPSQQITDSYEVTLKDFNTAFRSTPYSSPVHHSGSLADMDSNGTSNESLGLSSPVPQNMSSPAISSTGSTSLDDCRGSSTGTINWGSVLSLGSQSDLDPLNNNSFAVETWPTTTVCGSNPVSSSSTTSTPTSGTSVLSSPTSGPPCSNVNIQNGVSGPQSSSQVHATQNTLTSLPPLNLSDLDISGQSFVDDIGWKLSADDVLKAFPSDEQIFVGP